MNTEDIKQKADAKIDQWERKLLDLSLRNNLLNMKIKGNMIPLFTHSPAILEDKLAESIDYSIKPRSGDKKEQEEVPSAEAAPAAEETPSPAEAPVPEEAAAAEENKKQTIPVKEYDLENISDITGFDKLITDSFEKKILYSSLTKSDLDTSIKKLYRSAKTALEENGANTLYIALGVMKWFDKDGSAPHYAPLVLIPVDLVRKSIILGYVIRRRDEEPIINITLLEKLKQDFGIKSDPKEIMATDDSGIDINKVFENFRVLMTGQENWEIYNSCVIGMFSFTNFVMWNDLHVRRNEIGENKIVKSLLEGKLAWDAKDMKVPDKLDESTCLLPITADSSQLYAIQCATRGESFVLHGPPGTGKSQTIPSMIADMLANGKKVLFAAEKKAALDVVYNRLDKIGLGPFCLELHSNKAKKSAFLTKLKEAVELNARSGTGDYQAKLDELAGRRHELDAYCAALHAQQKCGMSLYELINLYAANDKAPDIDRFDDRFIEVVNADTYRKCETDLEGVLSAGRAMTDIRALSRVRADEYSQSLKSKLPDDARALKNAAQVLEESYGKARSTISGSGIAIPGLDGGDFASVRRVKDIVSAIADTFALPAKLCAAEDYEAVLRNAESYRAETAKAAAGNASVSEFYKPEIYGLDIQALVNEYREASNKTLFKSMAQAKVYKKMEPYRVHGSRDEQFGEHLAMIADVLSVRQNCDRIYNESLASYFDRAVLDDGQRYGQLKSAVQSSFSKLDGYDRTMALRRTFAANPVYSDVWNTFMNAFGNFDEAHSVIEEDINIKAVHDDETFAGQYDLCDDLINNIENLRDRIMFNKAASDARADGLINVVNAYSSGALADCDVVPAFRKAYAKLLITDTIDKDDALRNFSGKIFEERVEQFRKLNDEFTALTRQEIYLRVASSIPDLAREAQKGSALGILQHAIRSGGRGVSIRTLFTQAKDLIMKLCPCLLMSPISVAQYLEPGVLKVDAVIFDEASQLPTCKAVGVIARAENAIIVGDPNQMPPTSFFQSQNYDEENYEIEDLESILDDCLALSMPGTHLLWHYRSKHESLITFSNRAFYDNRLYTFPSSNDLDRKVSFVKCEGTFDRGRTRTNTVEAERVVEEIIRRVKDNPNRSLGVVTFNISQQDKIDDLLSEACRRDPALEEALYGSDEPLFIKNLENVQGDERDVILFSVGYGTDEEGKTYMNFGPLSQDGGWRRLNVAVTRSRYEMVVFSSLEPEQIKVTSDTARGVVAFRSFLEYAQGRPVWENLASTAPSEAPVIDRFDKISGVADDICDALGEAGYKTVKNVGSSEYKIDIGVVDPRNENEYCLGILLDGKFYLGNKTTSGREIYQMNVLTGLGWKLMRVWTVDWWENRNRVIEGVLNKLAEVTKEEEEVPVETGVPEEAGEPEAAGGNEETGVTEEVGEPEAAGVNEETGVTEEVGVPEEAGMIGEAAGKTVAEDEGVTVPEAMTADGVMTRDEDVDSGAGSSGETSEAPTEEADPASKKADPQEAPAGDNM